MKNPNKKSEMISSRPRKHPRQTGEENAVHTPKVLQARACECIKIVSFRNFHSETSMILKSVIHK